MTTTLQAAFQKALRAPGTPEDAEFKVARMSGTVGHPGVLDGTEDGVVEALVSVTGVADEVGDVILPGAYLSSLKVRTPKGVFSHDWDVWVSKTLDIAELMPKDPRLPAVDRKGNPWPAEAGALWVRTMFNLGTQPGREAYSNVLFFGDECEWSVGYNVPAGKSRKANGLRYITYMDTFEYGPVLFGAAPLSGTIATDERKSRERIVVTEQPFDVTAALEGKDLAEDLDLEEKAAGTVTSARDERLVVAGHDYWEHGEGAAKIRWGTDGDFMRCVKLVVEHAHMTEDRAKGYCALRHRGATGGWPGHAPAEEAESAAKKGTKTLMTTPDSTTRAVSADATVTAATTTEAPDAAATDGTAAAEESPKLEVKAYGTLPGSNEALDSALNLALRALLLEPGDDNEVHGYVSVDATFPPNGDAPGRVICTVNDYSDGTTDRQSWQIPFTITGEVDGDPDDVNLGEPDPVEIVMTVRPDDDAAADAGGAELPAHVAAGVGLAVKTLGDLLGLEQKDVVSGGTITEPAMGADGAEAAPVKAALSGHLLRRLRLAHAHLGALLTMVGAPAATTSDSGTKSLEPDAEDQLPEHEALLLRARALAL